MLENLPPTITKLNISRIFSRKYFPKSDEPLTGEKKRPNTVNSLFESYCEEISKILGNCTNLTQLIIRGSETHIMGNSLIPYFGL